jgi:hypothetical protein
VDSGVVLLVWSEKHEVSVRVSIKLLISMMLVVFIEQPYSLKIPRTRWGST